MKRLLFALALLIPFSLMPNAAASHDTAGYCEPDEVVFHGTTGNDTVVHSNGNNWCYDLRNGADNYSSNGLGGNAILAGGGNDIITFTPSYIVGDSADGEGGNDTIYGGDGDDILYGGPGDDEVRGEGGGDTIFGAGPCNETGWYGFAMFPYYPDPPVACSVNDGSDYLYGGYGDHDWIWDSNSDQHSDGVYDYINGGPGSYDICVGGPEDDFVACETVNEIPNV